MKIAGQSKRAAAAYSSENSVGVYLLTVIAEPIHTVDRPLRTQRWTVTGISAHLCLSPSISCISAAAFAVPLPIGRE